MKRSKVIIFLFALYLAGCTDWLGDDVNPNMLSEPPIDALLTTTIEQTARTQFEVSQTTSLYAQYLASPSASEIDRYGRVTLDNCWTLLYRCMANANDLYLEAIKQNSTYHAGAALVMQSYNALTATDLWGDIPFSQAFKGPSNIFPEYDSQEAVYDTIIKSLSYSVKLLNQSSSRLLNGDILFNNEPESWIKFAYALKARALIHLSGKSNFDPAEVLAAIDSSFTRNSDDAMLVYSGTEINPWYSLVNSLMYGGILNGYLSSQLIESLKGTASANMPFDPRITTLTDTLDGNNYAGTINGGTPPASGFCTLTFNSWQAQKNAPILFITYPEIKFIEAEVALMVNDKARAYNAYLEGIKSDFELLNLTDEQTNAYLSSTAVAPGSDGLTFAQIRYQKWIALNLQPEGWTEVRRNKYNYPGMELPENVLTNNQFIYRILYPDSETGLNAENVPKIDDVTTPLWWNKP